MLAEAVRLIKCLCVFGDEELVCTRKIWMSHEHLQHPSAELLASTFLGDDEVADVGVHGMIRDGPHKSDGVPFTRQNKAGGVSKRLGNLLRVAMRGPTGRLDQGADGGEVEAVLFVGESEVFTNQNHGGNDWKSFRL